MRHTRAALLLICLICHTGCGVLIGTVADSTVSLATYPVKEYVANGAYKYDNTWSAPYKDISVAKPEGDVLVGVAISGGGSRSAYFMATVLEQLSKTPIRPGSNVSVLDELDYISSVSGGSLASAYYCYERFRTPENRNEPSEQFFKRYKDAMALNFEMKALWRLIYGYWLLDLLTYYDRGDLIADVWDSELFNDATFADLAECEKNGGPTLIVNGTCVSNGLKFVFSTLPDSRFNKSRCFRAFSNQGLIRFAAANEYKPFFTMGFQSLNSDISRYRISKAVAASASVPNLLGPVTLQAKVEHDDRDLVNLPEGYLVNVTDGGVYDNYGVESLVQLFTEKMDQNPNLKAHIIVVDGSGFFNADPPKTIGDGLNVAYWSERTLAISWLRTKAYMEYVFQRVNKMRDENGTQPYKNLRFDLISLYDALPSQVEEDTYADIVEDEALKAIIQPHVTATDFIKKLVAIQTRFRITDEDREALDESVLRSAGHFRRRYESTEGLTSQPERKKEILPAKKEGKSGQ